MPNAATALAFELEMYKQKPWATIRGRLMQPGSQALQPDQIAFTERHRQFDSTLLQKLSKEETTLEKIESARIYTLRDYGAVMITFGRWCMARRLLQAREAEDLRRRSGWGENNRMPLRRFDAPQVRRGRVWMARYFATVSEAKIRWQPRALDK